MKFLVDESISWRLARDLAKAGHDAVHVDRAGLLRADDARIFDTARSQHRIVITQDIDFEALLLATPEGQPSVILFRNSESDAAARCRLLLINLPAIAADLEAGAIIVVEEHAMRVHRINPDASSTD